MKHFEATVCRAIIVSLLVVSGARADMQIAGHSGARHNRFHMGTDRQFLGEAFDLSGVGGDGTYWATMISRRYFVSATHHHPPAGITLTFHEGNSPDSIAHEYVVDDWNFSTGDLWVGRLATAIPPEHAVHSYPILALDSPARDSTSDYAALNIFCYGQPNVLGRNRIDLFNSVNVEGNVTKAATYFYDKPGEKWSLGKDEAGGQFLDSGAPSFVAVGGRLALVGIHSTITTNNDGVLVSTSDTFLPRYLDELEANVPDVPARVTRTPRRAPFVDMGPEGQDELNIARTWVTPWCVGPEGSGTSVRPRYFREFERKFCATFDFFHVTVTEADGISPVDVVNHDSPVTGQLGDLLEDGVRDTSLQLTLSDLAAGTFLLSTFHHNAAAEAAPFDIYVSDALGTDRLVAENVAISTGTTGSAASTSSFLIYSGGQGDDILVKMVPSAKPDSDVSLNGFWLRAVSERKSSAKNAAAAQSLPTGDPRLR